MNNEKVDYTLKILTIGESGVGKTCVFLRYTDNKFMKNHLTTIGIDYKAKLVKLDGVSIKIKIWDTAGQERFRNITQQYYKGADGIVLVYDVTDRNSYEKIYDWMKQIDMYTKKENIVIVLLGNKSDLEEKRCVSKEEGIALANEFKINYFETSAFKGTNVEESFNFLAKEVTKKKKPDNPNKPNIILESDSNNNKGSTNNGKKKGCC